jgi:hypothetical protein
MLHSFRPFSRLVTVAALAILAGAIPLRAQDVKLQFADNANGKNLKDEPLVRPNLAQSLFLYLTNSGAADKKAIVEIRAGGEPLEGGKKELAVKKGKPVLVEFGAPPKKEDKPPTGNAAPPAWVPVKGGLKVVLTVEGQPAQEIPLEMANPNQYVDSENAKVEFFPAQKVGDEEKKSQLRLELHVGKNFMGPNCRVELVLPPKRIPGLVAGQKQGGTYADYLTVDKPSVVLTADDLQFEGAKRGEGGLFYLRIDGYERAVTYKANFPEQGKPTKPDPVTNRVLRLNAPPIANPGAPLPVGVEVDNVPGSWTTRLALVRGSAPVVEAEFKGPRKVQVLVDPTWKDGALVLKPEASDWSTEVNANGVFGKRDLTVVLLDGEKMEQEFLNSARPSENVTKITETIVFDGTGPEGIKFVDFPKTLAIGAPLPVKLTASDPESQIKEVVFYVGKPGPDGKPPKEAELVPGKLVKDLWVAELTPATDRPATLDVSARVTNGANMTANDTVKIQLVPAGAAGAGAGKASIQGVVYEGTRLETGRKQPELVVSLVDDKGVIKDSVKTNKDGVFLFTDVPPGAYRVAAAKTGSMTKGATAVQVAPGEKKENVEIKLLR